MSLNPTLNVRVFDAGSRSSIEAARRWLPGWDPAEGGAWNLLLEGVDPALAAPVREYASPGVLAVSAAEGRLLVGGPPASLRRLAESLAAGTYSSCARELDHAFAAFAGAAEAPAPTRVMGILNVTPDSFSDGGLWSETDRAVEHALEMIRDGADIIDVGGESTRPGAQEVPAEEELRRVLPVIEQLRSQTGALISIDTRKASVAGPCLDAGANWVNDVSGLTHDPALAGAVARRPGTSLVLMHSRSRPADESYSTGYDAAGRPAYEDVVADTMRWLRRQARLALDHGIPPEALWIDPGFGFGKTSEQNVELLRRLREYTSTGLPILVGTSRKSTVGRLAGDLPPDQRLEGTAATVTAAILRGASAVRVHDVKEMARVARAADALR